MGSSSSLLSPLFLFALSISLSSPIHHCETLTVLSPSLFLRVSSRSQVWLSSALCCRLAVPLGVNESSKARNYIPGSKPSLLPKADDELEKEQRRRVFWLGFM